MINFDLISDLNLTTLDDFNWDNKATSLYCIIAGNIAFERHLLYEFLDIIQDKYIGIFFIDGDLEHCSYNGNFEASYADLKVGLKKYKNILYLHENIIVLEDVTLIGTNGWTTFDFTNKFTVDSTMDYLTSCGFLSEKQANDVFKMAISDQHYLYHSVEQCQNIDECQKIVLVSNSVPVSRFITHNNDFDGTILGDTIGNNGITGCLSKDTKGKVVSWMFGKFPEDVDYNIDGIRYVNNPRIDKDLDIYFPKVITL